MKVIGDINSLKSGKEQFVFYCDTAIVIGHDNLTKNVSLMFNSIAFRLDISNKTITVNPMDDWSDIKFIDKYQLGLKELIKLGIITDDYKFTISNNINTTRSLGSNKVSNILKFDTTFEKIIPYAFHGTTTTYLPSILKNGLNPRSITNVMKNWDGGYLPDSSTKIYLTIDYDRAMYYAKHAVEAEWKINIKSKPIVIRLKNVPLTNVVADDDYQNNMSKMRLMQLIRTGKEASVGGTEYIESIRNSSQFSIKGTLDIKFIDKVYKV